MMSRYKVRKAEIQEASQIADLVNSAYRGESSRRGWTTEADLLDGQRTDAEAILELITMPKSQMLVLDNGKFLLGCVRIENLGEKLYLGMLTVNPEIQNKGFGKLLMEAAEKEARSQNLLSIEMTVFSQRETLINYYLRQGYKLTGERRPFPGDDPRLGIPKQPLEFVVLEKKFR